MTIKRVTDITLCGNSIPVYCFSDNSDLEKTVAKHIKEEIEKMAHPVWYSTMMGGWGCEMTDGSKEKKPVMEKVIFFDRTCRVFWSDGTQTEVVCMKNDPYSEEGILGIAIAKKFLGSYSPMSEVLEGLRESNGNLVYIRLTPEQKAEIKRKEKLALEKEKRIATEKERQEINARRKEKRIKKRLAENEKKEEE